MRRETGKDGPISGIRLSDQLHRRAHVGGPRCRLTETRAYRALKSIEGQPRRSSRISGTRFCIPRQDSRDTGWDRGYRWYCSQFSNFWWYRTVGPVGPPWRIADPGGQPWAHWSHLSVPPVRANSCGVPPVPPVPPEETVRRNEDGIWNHDGSLSRGRLQGTGRRPRPRGLIPLPPCLLLAKSRFAHRRHPLASLSPGEGPSDRIARPGGPHSGEVTE